MSETRMLLAKISALRQRLEQAHGLANEARSAAAALIAGPSLEQAIASGEEHDQTLDAVVRPLTGEPGTAGAPRHLSSRARRVLERGRDLLGQLRGLADVFAPPVESGVTGGPLAHLYRDTVSMIDTTLRTVALLPDSTTTQMHLCQGLEVTLEEVMDRLRTLLACCGRQQHEEEQIARLGEILQTIELGQPFNLDGLRGLADELLAEARECEPLRFLSGDPNYPVHFTACHGLTVGRVLARIVKSDPELRSRPQEVVLAGLLMDVGMLGIPEGVLTQKGELSDEQRRMVEAHCVVGAQRIASLIPDAPWLAEAIGTHHERLDGTGYPDGLKGNRIRPLARMLAVCDIYVALCCHRSHRPARATRTALADTLMLAEQGQLDRGHAECLLTLSFYPIGSVVELAHGAVGVVVATPGGRGELSNPARPVVALLTNSQGEPLPRPQHLDLATAENHSIVRLLGESERSELLGRHFPAWAA